MKVGPKKIGTPPPEIFRMCAPGKIMRCGKLEKGDKQMKRKMFDGEGRTTDGLQKCF
jgi:hypothetical protein